LHTTAASRCSMKKGYSSLGRTCRLLTLLLIVLVVVGSAANQVNGASIGEPLKGVPSNTLYDTVFKNTTRLDDKNQHGVTKNIRHHLLYHQLSDRFVALVHKGRKGVRARGRMSKGRTMAFNKLVFISTSDNTIIIRAIHSDLHMCFNRRGKLIARHKNKPTYCEFTEIYSEDGQYTQYMLASKKHSWYVGFDQRGKPVRGNSRSSVDEECFNFLKMPVDDDKVKHGCVSGIGPKGVNFCDNKFLGSIIPKEDSRAFPLKGRQRHKHRHEKNHKRRRKVG